MQKNELTKYIDAGYSTRDIANTTQKSQTNVRHWLKKFGLKTNRLVGDKRLDNARKCSICGDSDPSNFYGQMKHRCGSCHNNYSTERGRSNRRKILDHLGGKCVYCSFNKWECSLQVHHTDPTRKDPSFASHRGWKWERIVKELEGCVILCGQCHPAVHAGIITLDVKKQ